MVIGKALYLAPKQNRCWSPRMNRRPPEIAGVAETFSPSVLVASTLAFSPPWIFQWDV